MAKAFVYSLLCILVYVGLCTTATGQILVGSRQLAVVSKLLPERRCVVERALSQRHVREKTGQNDGREVERYLALLGYRAGTSWCGAFVNWCYTKCGQRPKVNVPARAASWFADKSRLVYRMGTTVRHFRTSGSDPPQPKCPQPGDLAGFSWSGHRVAHVEMVIEWDADEDEFLSVGGNTAAPRNTGDPREGVHLKRRNKEDVVVADWLSPSEPGLEGFNRLTGLKKLR